MRNLYWSGLLTAVTRELARCKLDLVGVQEVRWDIGKRKKIVNLEQDFLCTRQNSVSSYESRVC